MPEDWRPGLTFHVLPWNPVVVAAVVGVLTLLVFLWRTVLPNNYQDLNEQKEKLSSNFARLYEKIANAENFFIYINNSGVTISTMHEGVQKYQETLRKYDEDRSKVQVLVDEAKLQEDALKAHVLSFEKDNCALKEQKKSLLQDAKDWQKKHVRLSEEIKGDHNTQTELENALVHKENEIEVLSGCIAKIKSLEACNDEELRNNKNRDRLKLHLKQIMDVSRIKATLSVINNERNRWFRNFMAEQKVRQQLEEEYQKVMQDQTDMKNEKAHLKNQYKDLQQRLEITTEFYHQKENILHQKLTQEELKHREKESKLSEVEGRTLQAEEELNLLRQKVKDMQEEMQQNERSLKAEIAVQEKKAHENWLKARASERTLIEEKRECVNLRQKIVKLSNKMSDLQRLLYRSGPPERHMPPLQRDMSGPRTSSPHTQDGSAYGPPLMGRPLPPPMPPPNAHYQPMIPPGPPFGADPRFRPPHIDFYRPPFPLRPYGPVPPRPFEEYQKVMHDQMIMKNETHLENQYKNLQQRLGITTEFYHQKENSLHQKLTQEELERCEKESKLSEVEGRTLQTEEKLNLLRQKVEDMQEEMQQNERSLKAEIAVQEQEAHENWLKARASERSLIEEKRECVNLRQKIVEFSDKKSDLEHSLYRSGPPERHMPPLQRAIVVYGLGVGFTFLPADMFILNAGSKLVRRHEIRFPGSNALPKAYGPPPMGGPLPPSMGGPLPPPMPPPNGHYQPIIPPGPPFGPDPRFRPPHMDSYRRPFPLRPYGPVPPRPFVHGPHLKDFPSMGPALHFIHEFPPNFPRPQDPFPPRPFPPRTLPPPGTVLPPAHGPYGPAPPTPLQPRCGKTRLTLLLSSRGAPHDAPPTPLQPRGGQDRTHMMIDMPM
ncbi:melanoma inhibitory activity protein 3 isoform X4 [Silurus meridionalis]|nr:melanoma inhibitory activity protein 3 isoform X4 [Silurus meridionalis]